MRFVILSVVTLTVFIVGFLAIQTPSQIQAVAMQQDDDSVLEQKRIDLLERRVTNLRQFVLRQHLSPIDLVRAQMDLTNARLDYVDGSKARKKLFIELLHYYDRLIEFAELSVVDPSQTKFTTPESDLLFLRSERIRVLILSAKNK